MKIVLIFVNSAEPIDMHSVSDISVSTLFTDVIVYSFLSVKDSTAICIHS